jgi:hypothetical protein
MHLGLGDEKLITMVYKLCSVVTLPITEDNTPHQIILTPLEHGLYLLLSRQQLIAIITTTGLINNLLIHYLVFLIYLVRLARHSKRLQTSYPRTRRIRTQ